MLIGFAWRQISSGNGAFPLVLKYAPKDQGMGSSDTYWLRVGVYKTSDATREHHKYTNMTTFVLTHFVQKIGQQLIPANEHSTEVHMHEPYKSVHALAGSARG